MVESNIATLTAVNIVTDAVPNVEGKQRHEMEGDGASVSRLRSELDAQISLLTPVLKGLAKRSTGWNVLRYCVNIGKLHGITSRVTGQVEKVRKELFTLKRNVSTCNEMLDTLKNGGTLKTFEPSERDNGIEFRITLAGETSTDWDTLTNADYSHIRKYAGSANNPGTRTVDNSEDAYAVLEMQLAAVLGFSPQNGDTLEIKRDSRIISKTATEARKKESFVFNFVGLQVGDEMVGMVANVKSLTATAKSPKVKMVASETSIVGK